MAVYMISEGEIGPVKIGCAIDPVARRTDLQVGNPRLLTLLRMFEGSFAEEHLLHEMFSEQHLRGDWFSLTKGMFGDVGLQEILPEPKPSPVLESPPEEDPFAPEAVLDGALLQSRLKQLRRSRGLTQEQLASAVGISRSAIASIEAGHDLPGRDLMARLAIFYGTPLGLVEAPLPPISSVNRSAEQNLAVTSLVDYMAVSGQSMGMLAERLGVSLAAVQRYVAGKRIPVPSVMNKLVEISNGQVQPGDFFLVVKNERAA